METYINISALELSVSEPLTDVKQYTSCIILIKNKLNINSKNKRLNTHNDIQSFVKQFVDGHS
jgi:hypothetical protein